MRMAARCFITVQRRSSAPSTRPAANSTASSVTPSADHSSYPQIPRTRLKSKDVPLSKAGFQAPEGTHHLLKAYISIRGHTDPARGRPSRRGRDSAGTYNYGDTGGEWHPHAASARAYCQWTQ